MAEVLTPSAVNALGFGEDAAPDGRARARCRSRRPPCARPATAGTELGDKKGLWVELRRRTRLRSDPEAPLGERRGHDA